MVLVPAPLTVGEEMSCAHCCAPGTDGSTAICAEHVTPVMVRVTVPGLPAVVPVLGKTAELVEPSAYEQEDGLASWMTVTCWPSTVRIVCRCGPPAGCGSI